ncbi:MAG TPA: ATP synthase F0 subunit B, partial [Polyangiaceae bacterium]|nr:ATP synthase F0 subunit B [Polyangiaceae bacterium]
MRLLRLFSLALVLGALVLPFAFAGTAFAAEQAEGTSAQGEKHEPGLGDINWFYGMVGEKEGVPPSVLYRPKGMPAPFGALLLNAALLYLILFRVLGPPITQGLKDRKQGILRGMDEAARMKREAKRRLREFEDKLENIDDEIERVRREMREAGEADRARILAEAKERRTRMERDAQLLIEQELGAAREALLREATRT